MSNVTKPYKGLHKDSNYVNQPQGTYTFAKNAVVESLGGDLGVIANENGNEPCAEFPKGFIPIGETYMTNGYSAVFLANPETGVSQIGIKDAECGYTAHVTTDILDFRVSHQIDVIYRLRRGCERTVYFVDGYNVPRVYNFDKPGDFQNDGGDWDASKFNLFKSYNTIPVFDEAEILLEGSLAAGSYYAAIQYLDADLNPTEWIAGTDSVIIYHDNVNVKPFEAIRGSTNETNAYQDYGPTGKAIKFNFSNLDLEYPFYRVAIVEHTTGNGAVTRVIYSSEVSTRIASYTYTGTNGETVGTLEELQQYTIPFVRASHIDQLDNRLILSDIQGDQINWCNIQKYASKIKTDLVLKDVILNDIDQADNHKRGTVHTEAVGYMPGEIYALSITYLLDNNQLSPNFHIPGRAMGFQSGMSLNNKLTNNFYVGNDNCQAGDYWGVDSQGVPLEGTAVRHHRLPLRSEIDEPLLTQLGENTSITNNTLYVTISGTPNPGFPSSTVTYLITYEVDGSQFQESRTLDLTSYDPELGSQEILIAQSLSTILFVSVTETDGGGAQVSPDGNSDLTYTSRLGTNTVQSDDSVYRSKIMGMRFYDIEVPDPRELNGHTVIGYYICRAERAPSDRTIMDTGVFTPLIVETRDGVDRFVSHGHLNPQGVVKKNDVFALIHPEHKFRNREYTGTTEYLQEGNYVVTARNLSDELVQDVQPGTSYDSEAHRRRERDSDGFDLHVVTRDNTVTYQRTSGVLADQTQIEDTFYLDTLFSKTITDSQGARKSIFNLSGDNKIGIVQLNEELDPTLTDGKLPYVVMRRTLSDPYANFRILPYYKETTNPTLFVGLQNSETTVFNGDSYISSMRYTSSMFYDIRLANRRTRTSVLNFIVGVLSIIAGAAITVFTAGIGTAAGIAVAGFGVSQIASGLKKDQIARVYQDLYEQGLEDTVQDSDTESILSEANYDAPDDEIQYFYDTVTNLWFESNVNMNWRMGNTIGLTDFLDAPGVYEETSLNNYAIEKVTNIDTSADNGRVYQGYVKAEIYDINEDYAVRGRSKVHFHLGIEYDCCSECGEQFPHRTYYSEPSFQEELTDNYRVFLPNNYRDLNGETGVITNIFTIQNNLYLHTEEALWHLPQNYQERVTGDIVSFIGTGSYFEIPPRKIVDDSSGISAGTQHKWSYTKTPHGVLFVSERQGVIFLFNGNKLVPISSEGIYSWVKDELPVAYDKEYLMETGEVYPYRDNPSHPFGTGFLTTYDSRLERLLVTKRDFRYATPIATEDYRICGEGSDLVVFNNFSQIIADRESDGWIYLGIEDCELQFQKPDVELIDITTVTQIPNNADIHVFLDTSGSFGSTGGSCLTQITDSVNEWVTGFQISRPDWTGSLYFYNDATERWVRYASTIASTTYAGQDLSQKDVIVVSFCNESAIIYHGNSFTPGVIEAPTQFFLDDYNEFVNTVYPAYNSFIGIKYPIAFGPEATNCGSGSGEILSSKEHLQHVIAAIYGVPLNLFNVTVEIGERNPALTPEEWAEMMNTLMASNPYPDDGLRNYGWTGKFNRDNGSDGVVITPEQFSEDIEELLRVLEVTETEQVEVPTIIYDQQSGETLPSLLKLDKSWTLSWSIKFNAWVSWHSYLPSFYLHTPDRFYSWVHGNDNLWLHNTPAVYQRYYGDREAFIVEFVSASNPLDTRVWDYINILTEAYQGEGVRRIEQRFITFNKAVIYNDRQCSGMLELSVKDDQEDYMISASGDEAAGVATIDRNERDWSINNFRDIRSDYAEPMFTDDLLTLQNEYYIDKIINEDALDENKDWTEVERFRSKYLVVRLIFDNFEDVKLLFNYSVEFESDSPR